MPVELFDNLFVTFKFWRLFTNLHCLISLLWDGKTPKIQVDKCVSLTPIVFSLLEKSTVCSNLLGPSC